MKQIIIAFLVGGGICLLGQLLIDLTKLTPARILTAFAVCGVLLGAVGVYRPLIDFAGAGATVPLLGFGANLAFGVKRAVDENGWSGALTGPLTAASGGIAAVLLLSLLAAVIFKRGLNCKAAK
ncbi:MAG: SpoVA/SpoVAEb family sporulation membrane protein [Oscillospiraceae bacterium]|nr:SpoVA/SpoVAEb family sporulation membrane protein [Oscillospiraceae bacterium]